MTVRGFSAIRGGAAAGGGAAVGVRAGEVLGAALGVVTVVTVSGGSWGARDMLGAAALGGAALGGVVCGADVTVVGAGAPTVALVEALSPLLRTTAAAIAPTANTEPTIAVTGRKRKSSGQPVQW